MSTKISICTMLTVAQLSDAKSIFDVHGLFCMPALGQGEARAGREVTGSLHG